MTVLVAILLAPFAILTAVFAIEIFVGLRPARSATCAPGTHTAVIVIPAHDEAEVIGAIVNRPREQSVVITGRGGGAALRDAMDTVSEVKDIKHAFTSGIKARKGVDY